MRPLTRRDLLRRSAALAAAGWGGPAWLGLGDRVFAYSRAAVSAPAGTTLEATIVPFGAGLYKKLGDGPGLPLRVREELAAPKAGREDRREALASIVHLTDVHVIDAQSTTRVEFLDRYADPPATSVPFASAFRAHETLTAHVAESMVQRINAIGRGPVTGRVFDCAVSTGDNIDNQQTNELEWFLTLLDGGRVTANSAAATGYEGVQDQDALTYDVHYWHPDDPRADGDNYKKFWAFPSYPGLLAAAVAPFDATGLAMPWFTINGNHDGLAQGNAPANDAMQALATGPVKPVGLPAGMSPGDFQNSLVNQTIDPAMLATAPARAVTPDPARRYLTVDDYIKSHLASAGRKGPKGHGLTAANLEQGTLYYAFDVAPGVRGIALDTLARGGYADGAIGREQLTWAEAEIQAVSSRWFDAAGKEVRGGSVDKLVVLFSHHAIASLGNPMIDPAKPTDERVLGPAVEALLLRYPNVVCWVNGHSHKNQVVPHKAPAGGGGFWEVLTSAHVDYPEQARLIEIVDNRDGTLSIFGTLIEHAAPAATTVGATDVLGLAAISRELSFNDFQQDIAVAMGSDLDRNVELLVNAPFVMAASAPPGPGASAAAPTPRPVLPATGGGVPVAAAAAAVAGALVLRRRTNDGTERGD